MNDSFDPLDDKSLNIKVNKSRLYEDLKSLRLIKTKDEIEMMRKANQISGEAHIEIMKTLKPNTFEYLYDGMFTGHCIKNG
jgi:Xaa-Pro dipeptidase